MTRSGAVTHAAVVVGAGRMGQAHATAWERLGVPVRWAVSPRRRPALAAAPDAGWATDLDQALADPAVTIVSICTPTPSHADLAVRALAAGRHVLLEKPIALTVADAERVAAAAEDAPGILMVAHVVRFFPAYAALLERVASGGVGHPRAVRTTRLSAAGSPDEARWLQDEERSGGLVVDFAIHDIDQANALLGAPRAVTALPMPGDGFGAPVAVTIEYAEGGIAQILAAADLPAGTPFQTSLDVVGDAALDALADAPGDPFEEQARYLLECIAAGVRPRRAPVAAAVEALRVSLAARESLRTGARVVLAE